MLQAKVGGGWYAQAGPQLGFLIGTEDKVGDVQTFFEIGFKKTEFNIWIGLAL
jgi:hypothetical protein